jgi:hypothetical protein
MSPGTMALDAVAAAVLLAMFAILLMGMLSVAIGIRTVVTARRRAAAPPAAWLTDLSRGCAVGDLADIDAELQRIAESENSTIPSP